MKFTITLFAASLLGLVVFPFTAMSCPVSTDVETGIVFEEKLENLTRTELLQKGQGDVVDVAVYNFPNGRPWISEWYGGLFKLSSRRQGSSSGSVTEFDQDLAPLFPLSANWSADVAFLRKTTRGDVPGRMTMRVTGEDTRMIGDCEYKVFAVSLDVSLVNLNGEKRDRSEVWYYAPELSFIIDSKGLSPYGPYSAVRHPMADEFDRWPLSR